MIKIYPPTAHHGRLLALLNARTGRESGLDLPAFNAWSKVRTFSIRAASDRRDLDLYHVFNPAESALLRLGEVWNKAWAGGIDEHNPCAPFLKEALLVKPEQIKMMQENSWSNILIAVAGGNIQAAIWGVQIDLAKGDDIRKISNYDLTTAEKTFFNGKITGNSRLCVSVVVDPAYNGYRTDKGISVGQAMVLSSLEDVVSHPYQTDVYAYSRPASLSRFIELAWGIRRSFGYRIAYDRETGAWFAEYEGKRIPAEIKDNGIIVGGQLFNHKNVNSGRLLTTRNGYVLEPKNALTFSDERGVYIYSGGRKEYLVEVEPYLASPFDQMVKFHGRRGGEIRAVFPQSRVSPGNSLIGDPISLNYNVVFKFPIGRIIEANDLYGEIYSLMTPDQRAVMKRAVISPDSVRRIMQSGAFKKDLFRRAFSYEKMEDLVKFAEANRERMMSEQGKE